MTETEIDELKLYDVHKTNGEIIQLQADEVEEFVVPESKTNAIRFRLNNRVVAVFHIYAGYSEVS